MNPKLLPCLALALSSGLFGCSTASQTDVANADRYRWGDVVGGFQMATSLDKSNGIIHCWIRNATTRDIACPSFDFGYSEFTKLEVQDSTNWFGLKPFIFPGGEESISPVPYGVKNIKPGQIVTNAVLNEGLHGLIENAVLGAGDNTNLMELMINKIKSRYALLTNLCSEDTFAFDFVIRNPLSDFKEQPPLKARVSQRFRVDGGKKEVTLYSPVFDLPVFAFDSSLFEACIKQQNERIAK